MIQSHQMKLILLALLSAAAAYSQVQGGCPKTGCTPSVTLSLATPGPVKVGVPFTVNISLFNTPGSNLGGVQFSTPQPAFLNLGVDAVVFSAFPGPVASALGINVQCEVAANILTCVTSGIPSAAIGDGILATIQGTLISMTGQNIPPSVTASITNPIAVSLTGGNVTLLPGPALVVPVVSACDVNQDGAVNAIDVALVLPAVLNVSLCTPWLDVDHDGICSVRDLLKVALAASGQACVAQ